MFTGSWRNRTWLHEDATFQGHTSCFLLLYKFCKIPLFHVLEDDLKNNRMGMSFLGIFHVLMTREAYLSNYYFLFYLPVAICSVDRNSELQTTLILKRRHASLIKETNESIFTTWCELFLSGVYICWSTKHRFFILWYLPPNVEAHSQ